MSEQLTDKSAAAAAIWWLRNYPWKPIGKLNWLFRSIRWRAVAAYNIGWIVHTGINPGQKNHYKYLDKDNNSGFPG